MTNGLLHAWQSFSPQSANEEQMIRTLRQHAVWVASMVNVQKQRTYSIVGKQNADVVPCFGEHCGGVGIRLFLAPVFGVGWQSDDSKARANHELASSFL